MHHQLISAKECVICLKEIDIARSNNSDDNDNNKGSILYLKKSVLKLLQLDNTSLSISNSIDSEERGNKEAQELFCRQCFDRNVQIHNLFDRIEALGRSLEGLKNCIDDQIREGDRILKEREQERMDGKLIQNYEIPGGLRTCLRYEMSKRLDVFSPISNDDYNNTVECEDDHDDNHWETKEISSNICTTAEEETLPKTCRDIKELSIAVQRLPRFIIPQTKYNLKTLPNSLIEKFKPLILCIVPGCKANKEFLTERARDQHMIAAHDIASSRKTSSKKSEALKTVTKVNCIYKDCDSSFNSKFGRYQHLRKCHGDLDFRQHLQEQNARELLSVQKREMPVGGQENSNFQKSKQNENSEKPNELKVPIRCMIADCKANKEFLTEKARDQHMMAAHDFTSSAKKSSDKNQGTIMAVKFNCIYKNCESTFNSKLARYQHLRKSHGNSDFLKLLQKENEQTAFPCTFTDCRESFDNEEARNEHMKTSHPNFRMKRKYVKRKLGANRPKTIVKKKPFCCNVPNCKRQQGFYTQADLDLHKRVVHEGHRQSYACKVCGKLLGKTNLWSHYQAVHKQNRKFICQYCGHACVSSSNLKRHITTHLDQKYFKCKVCEKEFKRQDGLVIHMRFAHTGERPFRCDRCGKGFVTSCHMTKHIKGVHEKDTRLCVCHICGKAFPIRSYLQSHMKNSHGDVHRLKKKKTSCDTAGNEDTRQTRHETNSDVNAIETPAEVYPPHQILNEPSCSYPMSNYSAFNPTFQQFNPVNLSNHNY